MATTTYTKIPVNDPNSSDSSTVAQPLLSTPNPTTTRSNMSIQEIATLLQSNIPIQDRTKYFTTNPQCFVGNEMIDYLIESNIVSTRTDAIQLGNELLHEHYLIENVVQQQRDIPFIDSPNSWYHFTNRGHVPINPNTGQKYKWSDVVVSNTTTATTTTGAIHPQLSSVDTEVTKSVWPYDMHNIELLNNVHPVNWQNPIHRNVLEAQHKNDTITSNAKTNRRSGNSRKRDNYYDLVVIGGGTGGLITAAGSAGVGARVALIEEYLLGGDCLNVGCVPSKTLIHSANLAHTIRSSNQRLLNAGISIEDPVNTVQVDFTKVMERVREVRSKISHHDSAERYSTELGVDVYIGRGTFQSKTSIMVKSNSSNQILHFKRAVIATGGAPSLLTNMNGFQELYNQCSGTNAYKESNNVTHSSPDHPMPQKQQSVPMVVTNETIFNLTKAPKKLIVIGTGVIGMELAQAMQRLGIPTIVLGRSGNRILNKEDEDLSNIIKEQMILDGVEFRLHVTKYIKIERTGIVCEENGFPEMKLTIQETNIDGSRLDTTELICDAVMVAIGRRPNVTGMGLETAQVEYDIHKGLLVNDKFQTTNKRIYGVGDCCSTKYQFTHAADFMARAVIRNALFFGNDRLSSLIIPHATFTSPEIASVGLNESDLMRKNMKYRIIEKQFASNDRSITDDTKQGLVRIRIHHKTDEIYGATIVGQNAGNMINEITIAMQTKTGLGKVASIIHPYPTTAEVIRQCGDLYNKTRLTSSVKKLLRTIIQLQR